MVTLLLLATNPIGSDPLRIDEELRDIKDCVTANPEKRIGVELRLAVRAQDLQKTLLELKPAIVHFSGHGDENGEILIENPLGYPEPVSAEALADLFRVFGDTVRCVVLNACNSCEQARRLSQFIDSAVGMEGSVSVGAGKAFSLSFYQALAYGKDVATAFELGRNQILLEGRGEEDIPRLFLREGVDTVLPTSKVVSNAESPLGLEALVRAQLTITTAALSFGEKLTLAPASYDEQPPPMVEKCSKREKTVERIQTELGERRWYAVHGAIGTGKTHLAGLLARSHTGRCLWLRLRDRTPAEALSMTDSVLGQVQRRQLGQSKASWYADCLTTLGEDAVLVLDDVPRTSGREEIDDSLNLPWERRAKREREPYHCWSPASASASETRSSWPSPGGTGARVSR
jgi:CHAT domain-containing protein